MNYHEKYIANYYSLASYDNGLDKDIFNGAISFYSAISKNIMTSRDITYTETDKSVVDNSGNGLLIIGENPIGFNALRNSVEDLDSQESDAPYQWGNFSKEEIENRNEAEDLIRKQTHAKDIHPRDFVEICLDWCQQGVGGYDSWGARPIQEATIYVDEEYNWSFTLIPVNKYNENKTALMQKK